jgi:hypothetical protein
VGRERIAAEAVALADPSVRSVDDEFNPIGTRQPTADHHRVTSIRIPMGGGVTIDLDDPAAAAWNHMDVLAHFSPFKVMDLGSPV